MESGSRHSGFSSCSPRGLVAPLHMGSSQTRVEPVCPSLAGRFLTTGPPGESWPHFLGQYKALPAWPFLCPVSPSPTPHLRLMARHQKSLSSLTPGPRTRCSLHLNNPSPPSAQLIPTDYANLVLDGTSSRKRSLIQPVRGPPLDSHNTLGSPSAEF